MQTSCREQLAILVASCDKYSDAWPLFFHLFWKHWGNCPLDVYLGTNSLHYEDPRVRTILIGDDKSWSHNLRGMLAWIPTPHVLMFLDDYFILKDVATAVILRRLATVRELDAAAILINASVPPDRILAGTPGIGEIEPGAPYRCSLNPAIWHRQTLLNLLRDGESPWDFEIVGSRRSDSLPSKFLVSTQRDVEIDLDGICRGKWSIPTVRIAMKAAIPLDLQRRQVMTVSEHLGRRIALPKKWILRAIPWKIRFWIGDFLRKVGLLKKPVQNRVTF